MCKNGKDWWVLDKALLGGNVLTMNEGAPRVEAVGFEKGKIVAAGATAEVSKMVGSDTQVVHLAGRTVIPGFVDPHNHFSFTTFQPVSVDCSVPPHVSINGVLDAIGAAAKSAPPGQWIWGWGFNARAMEGHRRITRKQLDEVAPDNPVTIEDSSVHAAYANTAALRLAGIDRNTPDPDHGQILRDDNGEPDGTLWEEALNSVYNLSLRAHLEQYGDYAVDLVRQNCQRYMAAGITSVGDALVLPEAAEMYRQADTLGKLPFRMHQMLGGDGFFSAPSRVASGDTGDGNVSDRLRGGTMKIFMDPVFPSPALIQEHPHGDHEHIGARYYTQEEADIIVLAAHRRGLQVAIHCLGTWSIEQALNAFEAALKAHPASEPRFRIEHYSLPTLEQIRRTASMGVVSVMQPAFVYTGAVRGQERAEELGGGALVFPFKTMLAEGVTVAASSDFPCAPLEPLTGIYAVVTRKTRLGEGPIVPDEAVTPLEALKMYTLNAAYAMNREHEVGSIETGKRADLAVLSHDPTSVDPDFIREISVEQTYVDGELLHNR
ncbi:MAG TPA: amidohydrolase [Dehalococcoidia bacterium]|jgi:predicted amidohydrolase YtcJ|nr:amidohydrolase [Dehalococcoidia bacterium]